MRNTGIMIQNQVIMTAKAKLYIFLNNINNYSFHYINLVKIISIFDGLKIVIYIKEI